MKDMNTTAMDNQDSTPQDEEAGHEEQYDIDLILDIPLDVSVELGRVKMLVNDLLQLGQGSIIELNKAVGEPLEIYISNKLVARGEVVVMDEQFGIRVTDIISPHERVKSLG
jgi:flagellar motor switch protein FliN/FliY